MVSMLDRISNAARIHRTKGLGIGPPKSVRGTEDSDYMNDVLRQVLSAWADKWNI
jgi:hypothetical protein